MFPNESLLNFVTLVNFSKNLLFAKKGENIKNPTNEFSNKKKAREDENKSTKETKVASKHKRDVTPSTSSSRKAPRRR
jgi:hypothetical protein